MKKIKILFCALFVGLSVSRYLIANKKSSATELFLLNVEALSMNEDSVAGDCVNLSGVCVTPEAFHVGMRFVH